MIEIILSLLYSFLDILFTLINNLVPSLWLIVMIMTLIAFFYKTLKYIATRTSNL